MVIHDINKHHRTRVELERIVRLRRGEDSDATEGLISSSSVVRVRLPRGRAKGSVVHRGWTREEEEEKEKGGVVLVYFTARGTLPNRRTD